ncbi:unnamed protein product, partial [Dovyalis caffra]
VIRFTYSKLLAEIKREKHDKGQRHEEVLIKIKQPKCGAIVRTKDHKKKATRLVEIEEPSDQSAIYLRQMKAEICCRIEDKNPFLKKTATA